MRVLLCIIFAALVAAPVASSARVQAADPANLVIQNLSTDGGGAAAFDVEFDNTTGEITRLIWTVNSGTLTVTVTNPPKPTITRTTTTSGQLNVPAGQYFLTQGPRGDWRWTGTISLTVSWSSG